MTIKPKTRTPIVQALARPRKPLWMRFQAQRTIPNICAMRKVRSSTNSPSRLAPTMLNSRSTRDSDRGHAWRMARRLERSER